MFRKILVIIILLSMLFHINFIINKENEAKMLASETEETLNQFESGCIVLNYHRINKKTPVNMFLQYTSNINEFEIYNVYIEDFERHMQLLKDNDVEVISIDELNKKMNNKTLDEGKYALITFDDIDETVYTHAYPILKKYNYPFTVFVVIGALGEYVDGVQLITEEQLKEMEKDELVTIGLHTYNMHYLDEESDQPIFLVPGNNEKFKEDFDKSKEKYIEMFGYAPKYFAYPFGYGNEETDEYLINNGIELIFSLDNGVVTNQTKEFFIPRIMITNDVFDEIINWFQK